MEEATIKNDRDRRCNSGIVMRKKKQREMVRSVVPDLIKRRGIDPWKIGLQKPGERIKYT